MPPVAFALLKHVMPNNGFSWPFGSAVLGRGHRDGAVAAALRQHVERFRRADVEPLLAAVFARAASRVAARYPEDANFVDFVDSFHRETIWARGLAFSLFFDLFCAVRDARHRHRADPSAAGPARHQLGALASAVDSFLDAAGDRWASASSATDGEERPLGGIDEELLLLAGSNDNAPAPDEEEGAMDADDAVTEPRSRYDEARDRRLAGSVAGLMMTERAPEQKDEDERPYVPDFEGADEAEEEEKKEDEDAMDLDD